MKKGNGRQKALAVLNDSVGRILAQKPHLQDYQAEIDGLLDNACDLESRREITDILYKSKHRELMDEINHLRCLLDNFG